MAKVPFQSVYDRLLVLCEEDNPENSTLLAESYCFDSGHDDWLDDSEHPIFDIALCAFDEFHGETPVITRKQMIQLWQNS